tara:strand:- start:2 stop:616 length:615 start_codon:yes stop_codon:yes gene_type:complete
MTSNKIFEYSNEFLEEIINDLIKLKIQKIANPKNNDFDNKLRLILGKNYNETQFQNLTSKSDTQFKEAIYKIFENVREERLKILGKEKTEEIEKRILLQSIDLNWKSHIQYLEQLRQVIGLRSYGQRDPLVEYKKEAFELFENLLNKLKLDYVTIIMNLKIVEKPVEKIKDIKIDKKYSGKKMRRNEPCFCGSGKKYKNCCGAL